MSTELGQVVREFFEILDRKEVSDGGETFSPTTIKCSRALTVPRLDFILKTMKELAHKELYDSNGVSAL